jgi:hypothetical protein
MLILADKNGYVGASVPGLAQATGFTVEQTEEALAFFKKPDPYSRTPDNEGKRIEDTDGGWLILNFVKYRGPDKEEKRREQNRLAKQRQRERQQCQQKMLTVSNVSNVSHNKNKNKKEPLTSLSAPSALLEPSVAGRDIAPSPELGRGEPFLLAIPSPTSVDPTTGKKTGKTTTKGSWVWNAYAESYFKQYKAQPTRNAKQNSLCKQLVERLGAPLAVDVAAYYPTTRSRLYVNSGHALALLVRDCEKIQTEMMTGNQMTDTLARQADRHENTRGVLERYLAAREGET